MKALIATLMAAALTACAAAAPEEPPAEPLCVTDLECAMLPELPAATPV